TIPLTDPVSTAALHRDPAGFESQPVCVGPYRLATPWYPGQRIIRLVRVPGYTGAVAGYTGGGTGYLDAITFRVFPTAPAAAEAVDAGTVDLAPGAPGIPVRAAVAVHSVTTGMVEYVGLPTGTPPFDQPAVRIALSEALDRAAIVGHLFPGTRRPAGGFLPPTVGASYVAHACGAATPAQGDPAAARATLQAAHVSLAGTSLGLYFNDDFRNGALAAAVAAQWRASLNIDVVLHPMSFPAFVATGSSVTGIPGAFRFSWQPPYPSADGYLAPLFTSAAIGQNNFSHFADPNFDLALTNEARHADSAVGRVLSYRQLNNTLCQQMPMVPLTFSVARWLVRLGVASTRTSYLDVTTGQPLLRELYFSSPSPARTP
ncbi:MAG: ABC transporter substrate-binding protein, partial [Mycobacteriales bacterium]